MTEPELREQVARLAPAASPADAATLAYLDSLLTRALQVRPAVAQRLLARAEARIKTALAAREVLEKTARDALAAARDDRPESTGAIENHLDQGNPRAALRSAARQQREHRRPRVTPLTDQLHSGLAQPEVSSPLERQLHAQERAALADWADSDAQPMANATAPPRIELRAVAQMRDTLAEHQLNRLMQRSAAEKPPESGPLNPHKLVSESLDRMRQLSPRYLARFVAQVDTLFWLEQAAQLNARNRQD